MSELQHYGMPRRSGRYPWGSGENPYQRSLGFRSHVQELRKEGMSYTDIARNEGITTTELRARISISKNEIRAAQTAEALKLRDKGYSPTEIGRRMGLNESTVRSLLDPAIAERGKITRATADMLKETVDQHRYIDVGAGVENHIGVSRTRLNTAIAELQEQGYKIHTINVDQVGVPGNFTTVKVLGAPDTKWSEIRRDVSLIQPIYARSDDFGRTYERTTLGLKPIQNVESSRIQVVQDATKDGVIELRRGVEDLDLGKSKYAQVRIGVDGTHYLKGMAIYSDNLPAGVDIRYNTNKSVGDDPKARMKPYERDINGDIDKENPFGATIKYIDGQRGALNIIREEGEWETWSKTLSSQALSKQTPPLAKQQLDISVALKKEEHADISQLTNPTIKKKLLLAFADNCESDAVHLKAAAMPRQASKVIIPLNTIKPNEVYAPTYNDGEVVVLIRYPHGGRFEIPQLTVNSKSKEGKSVLGQAKDAIGIHPSVAQKLSGADFDGDTVIIIPNNKGLIKTAESLKRLQDFDPRTYYPPHDGMKTIDGGIYDAKTGTVSYPTGQKKQTMQTRMGEVSNLITDMTIKGANMDEIAAAVRHSMVVIDAEKHHLNFKQSYIDNGIAGLAARYQNGARGGASTLISKASSEIRVPHRKSTPVIDKTTGAKVWLETGQTYKNNRGQVVLRTTPTTRMAETTDAHTLSSGRPIEQVYASYANEMKNLALVARREALASAPIVYSPSAKKTYANEVASLNASLNIALKNAPLERQAQILANTIVKRREESHPNLDADDVKKMKNMALAEARARTGAKKNLIPISEKEWEAIQAGAISPSKLTQILQNTDLDLIKQLATPRTTTLMSPAKTNRAKTLLNAGYTQAEVAEALGVSVSTLSNSL